MVFSFAGKQGDAKLGRLVQLWRELRQHRQRAANVKPTYCDFEPSGTECPRHVHRARELVGLHTNKAD